MKVTFVYPRFEKFLDSNPDIDRGLVDYFLGDFTTPPSLGIPIMAALTPPEVEVELVDDNSGDPVDFGARTDLVAINCFTPQATRAFEIADGFRARGTKVIMGGFFPSFMVEECLKHADSVNVGEVEPTWRRILRDAAAGRLERKYVGGCSFDVANLPIPKREIFYRKTNYDWDEDLIQITRGCLYNCAMCAIPAHMGSRIRFRPVDKVVEELKTLKFENVYLADDTLFFPHRKMVEYATELFKAVAPLGKRYFVASTMALNIDKEFLDLAARAGVANFYCTMNVDPLSIKALQGGRRERQTLIDLVKMLEDRNIRFFGSFAVGRDWDDTGIADRILDLYVKANIHTSEFFLFTPYPGTVHWDRLERQGRIIDRTWSHYNGAHVVARHPTMSEEQLYGQFIKIWREFFRLQKDRHAAHLEPATFKDGVQIVGKPLQRQGVPGQAAVTGVGLLSPIGNDPAAVASALREGRHGLAEITTFDASPLRTRIGGEIRNFNPGDHLTAGELTEYDDAYLRYAIAAARSAIRHAGLAWGDGAPRRDVALVLGTCNGGLRSAEEEYRWKHGKSSKAFDEKQNLQAQLYGFGKAMAAALGVGGEVWVVATACSSTTGALGLAQLLVNQGRYKTVIVGGSDSLCLANAAGFNGIKAMSTGRTAPFSVPEGLNVGEAACFWVVEDMESALLRSARLLGKLVGHATTCDAYHPTSPDPRGEGAYRTLTLALADSGLTLEQIGCINTHGTGTEANDRAECRGIAKLIGDARIPAVSLKSFFGHCMGTTGILEATCGLLAMNEGFIPPTLNFSVPRPGCALDCVPNAARDAAYGAFLSANYAFGGNNAAVVVARWDLEVNPPRREQRRVVITGSGVVSSLGLGVKQTVDALRRNLRGLGPVDALGLTNLKSRLAGLVPPFKAADVDRRLDLEQMNPISRFAAAAGRLALDNAGLRVSPKNAEEVGIAMGCCDGPDEMAHMDAVFSSDPPQADIGCFSNIVANSTAGWVANALMLKGVNATLAPGPHAGLQALAYAYEMVADGRAAAMLASAADEVYRQKYYNYDLIGLLYHGDEEARYQLRPAELKRKLIGEGAASLVVESLDSVRQRGGRVLAEVLGYGMSMDAAAFSAQAMGADGLAHALAVAAQRSGIGPADIDLVVWAPQGNAQDLKVTGALQRFLGSRWPAVPMVASTFNTGFVESASALIGIACALEALTDGSGLWTQTTGDPALDSRSLSSPPRHTLVCATTDLGYNYAVVLRNGPLQ